MLNISGNLRNASVAINSVPDAAPFGAERVDEAVNQAALVNEKIRRLDAYYRTPHDMFYANENGMMLSTLYGVFIKDGSCWLEEAEQEYDAALRKIFGGGGKMRHSMYTVFLRYGEQTVTVQTFWYPEDGETRLGIVVSECEEPDVN